MQRYADILKGRTMLELLYIPGIENKKYELMGEKALCVALELAQKLETIKEFSFVPRAFLTTLMTSLFSFGDLLSALLNLALRRVDAFFEVLSTLPPELHARKISDGTSLISEFLVLVKEELKTDYLFSLVMEKAMTSLLLAFNDHLLSWDTSGYSETHFINHVQACDALQQGVQSLYIDLSQRKVLVADSAVVAENKEPNRLVVSAAVQDAVRCTCSSSAQIAVAQSVNRLQESKLYLVEGMLNEQNMAWINGSLIAAFVNNLDQWTNFICSTLPQRFTYMVYLQVSRLLIKIYLANMIAKHRSKSRLICTERGVAQMAQDLMAIKSWICTYESNMNTVTEQHLIVVLQSFLLCAQKDIVQAFSEAILFFGMKYAYHGYDLLRLVLKFRPDVHDIDRKALLGLCSEFIVQVQRAMQRDQFSFELPTQDMAILDELLPRVGVEHCTGRRWKVITLPDPRTVHLTLSLVVAETCNKALAARRKTDGRTAYQSRKVDGSLTLSLPKTSAKEKPWGESSGESTPSGAPAADHTETDGPSSAKARPPPPPPRRRATIATVDTATTPEPSPSLQATVSEDNAMKKVEGGVDGAEDRSSSAFARVEGTGEDQGERGVVSGQEETKSAHHVRHHRKPPPPPPPARPKTAVIHAAPPADALVENAQDVPPAPPIRHPSPAPPPKPARRASAPPIAPSLIASSSPPPPTSSSPSLSRPLIP